MSGAALLLILWRLEFFNSLAEGFGLFLELLDLVGLLPQFAGFPD